MTGRYTREGDVRELVTECDDMFVISKPGDELVLSFAADNSAIAKRMDAYIPALCRWVQ